MSRTLTRIVPLSVALILAAGLGGCQTPADDPGIRGGPAGDPGAGQNPLDIGGEFALNEVTNVPKSDEGGGANVDGGGDPPPPPPPSDGPDS